MEGARRNAQVWKTKDLSGQGNASADWTLRRHGTDWTLRPEHQPPHNNWHRPKVGTYSWKSKKYVPSSSNQCGAPLGQQPEKPPATTMEKYGKGDTTVRMEGKEKPQSDQTEGQDSKNRVRGGTNWLPYQKAQPLATDPILSPQAGSNRNRRCERARNSHGNGNETTEWKAIGTEGRTSHLKTHIWV